MIAQIKRDRDTTITTATATVETPPPTTVDDDDDGHDDDNDNDNNNTRVLVWVLLFTDVAALGLVYFYLALLRRCTGAEVEQLRDTNTVWASAFFPLTVSGTPPGQMLH